MKTAAAGHGPVPVALRLEMRELPLSGAQAAGGPPPAPAARIRRPGGFFVVGPRRLHQAAQAPCTAPQAPGLALALASVSRF